MSESSLRSVRRSNLVPTRMMGTVSMKCAISGNHCVDGMISDHFSTARERNAVQRYCGKMTHLVLYVGKADSMIYGKDNDHHVGIVIAQRTKPIKVLLSSCIP